MCENGLEDAQGAAASSLLATSLSRHMAMLSWYRHVECSNDAVKTAFDIQVDGKRGLERPKMTWQQLTKMDFREWKALGHHPHDRHTWRSSMRSATDAASQLPERGPLMWMLPLYLHVNQNLMIMMMSNITGSW